MNMMTQLTVSDAHLSDWDTRASVRTQAVRKLDTKEGYPFSPDLVPYLGHALVRERGEQVKREILAHKFYDFSRFTVELETIAVVPVSLSIGRNELPFEFSTEAALGGLKIAVDEAHHALQASLTLSEMVEAIGVMPLAHKPEHRFFTTLRHQKHDRSTREKALLDLQAVCVSETLITGALRKVPTDNQVMRTVREVTLDHARDEAKHHAYYSEVVREFWYKLSVAEQDFFGPKFAKWIAAFIDPDPVTQAHWLIACGFETQIAIQIVNETLEDLNSVQLRKNSAKPTISLLKRYGILDHAATADSLHEAGLI